MEQKNPKVTVDLSPDLHKALQHKLIDEGLTVKALVRHLIELWVKGDISLPYKPVQSTRRGKKVDQTKA